MTLEVVGSELQTEVMDHHGIVAANVLNSKYRIASMNELVVQIHTALYSLG